MSHLSGVTSQEIDHNRDGWVTFEELHEGEVEPIDDDDRRDMEPPGARHGLSSMSKWILWILCVYIFTVYIYIYCYCMYKYKNMLVWLVWLLVPLAGVFCLCKAPSKKTARCFGISIAALQPSWANHGATRSAILIMVDKGYPLVK